MVWCVIPGATTNIRILDPWGVLDFLGDHVCESSKVMSVLLSNITAICQRSVTTSTSLSVSVKRRLTGEAALPGELRQLTRRLLRLWLCPNLPKNVQQLPVPSVIKEYILTGWTTTDRTQNKMCERIRGCALGVLPCFQTWRQIISLHVIVPQSSIPYHVEP